MSSSSPIIIHKNRTNIIPLSLGFDVSGDTFTSQIRSHPDQDAPLIVPFTVTFATDGTDGELILSIDDSLLADIGATTGYMDVKRLSGGEPLAVFDRPLEVQFRGTVTE